jgi:hypothetical protein
MHARGGRGGCDARAAPGKREYSEARVAAAPPAATPELARESESESDAGEGEALPLPLTLCSAPTSMHADRLYGPCLQMLFSGVPERALHAGWRLAPTKNLLVWHDEGRGPMVQGRCVKERRVCAYFV